MTFKQAAYKILKNSKKPLHSKTITDLAIKDKLIDSKGATPWATMNAILITDININNEKSLFKKSGPSKFTINDKVKYIELKQKDKKTILKEEFVKHSIIKYLSCKGWGNFEYADLHKKGVDIKAKKNNYNRYIFIETKGNSTLNQSNEVAFVYSLGQIVSRMKDSGTTRNYYGLGLPEPSAKIALRRIPW
ncbi:MAG TPA: winged helix-turn-helix domain-containing protein, partial [Candidatus Paceibacterota bacterium]|nr:winged helix-turn-helix domain-containing protein [Candidatus Paceibacterota bacterium]